MAIAGFVFRQIHLQRSTLPAPFSLKRQHGSPGNSDTQNVDRKNLNKRKRADLEDVTTSNPTRYYLITVPSTKPRPLASPTLSPKLDNNVAAQASAPAAAGRSPTRSRHQSTLRRKRFAPPQFGTQPSISIAAALSNTLVPRKSKKIHTIEESEPKPWFFDIYEETETQQDYTVNVWTMTQSATILQISDDESKARDRADRGKENIPPSDVATAHSDTTTQSFLSTKIPSSRKDSLTDEPRTPLGDTNAADYYPEGLDSSSVVLVQDDAPEAQKGSLSNVVAVQMPSKFTFESETVPPTQRIPGTPST